jgi:hypothetical protein
VPDGLQARQVPLIADDGAAQSRAGVADLSDAERELRDAAIAGRLLDLDPGATVVEGQHGLGPGCGPQHTIRASVLVEFLTDPSLGGNRPARAVLLRHARIIGRLDLTASKLQCRLELADCQVDEPVSLDDAHASSIAFRTCSLPSLSARQLELRGDLRLTGSAMRHLNVECAHIGGHLDLTYANLTGEERVISTGAEPDPDGVASTERRAGSADHARIDGDMLCDGLRATGAICLICAHIGGRLRLIDAQLLHAGETTLRAARARIDADVHCEGHFRSEGELSFLHATVGGLLDLSTSTLTNPAGTAIDLEGARIANLVLPNKTPPDGRLVLTRAHIGHLADNWPATHYTICPEGLHYDTLAFTAPTGNSEVAARLDWLEAAEDPNGNRVFLPHAYDQLTAAYRREGADRDARTVAVAKERRRRKQKRRLARFFSWCIDFFAGYGYQVWRGAVALLLVAVVGGGIFEWAMTDHHMTSLHNAQIHPQFNAWVYSIDALLPVVNLGQRTAWAPTGLFDLWYTASVLFGWLLVSVILAALTTRLVRD